MVLVYSRSGCAPCKTLLYWLNAKHIDYKEFDLDVSEFRIAPTVIIDEQILQNPPLWELARLLAAQSTV